MTALDVKPQSNSENIQKKKKKEYNIFQIIFFKNPLSADELFECVLPFCGVGVKGLISLFVISLI